MDPETVTVPDEMHEYFEKIEAQTGKTIPPDKRAWYAAKSGYRISADMKREYPSTPEEAFETSIEGAYFYNEMAAVRSEQRVRPMKPAPGIAVDTSWDIGYSDATAIIWFQVLSPTEYLILDYYENEGEALDHYAEILDRKRTQHGIIYGKHFGPHDLKQHSFSTGQTIQDFARNLGVQFTVLPKAGDKRDLIESTRRILPNCYFNEPRVRRLLSCLDSYRKDYKVNTGTYSEKPRKDWSTHGADAMQYLAYSIENFGSGRNNMTAERARKLREANAPPPVR